MLLRLLFWTNLKVWKEQFSVHGVSSCADLTINRKESGIMKTILQVNYLKFQAKVMFSVVFTSYFFSYAVIWFHIPSNILMITAVATPSCFNWPLQVAPYWPFFRNSTFSRMQWAGISHDLKALCPARRSTKDTVRNGWRLSEQRLNTEDTMQHEVCLSWCL